MRVLDIVLSMIACTLWRLSDSAWLVFTCTHLTFTKKDFLLDLVVQAPYTTTLSLERDLKNGGSWWVMVGQYRNYVRFYRARLDRFGHFGHMSATACDVGGLQEI